MKSKLLSILTAVILILIPNVNFGQRAPALGAASSFALFTAGGAFTVTGASTITGNVGAQVGAFTGFPPGTLFGQIHVADPTSVQAGAAVAVAYSYLTQSGTVIGVGLGNGQTLSPGVYQTGAASTLNGNLTLNGGGNPNAIFIIRIGGALATGASSTVTLTNSASVCNVYWQIGGQFDLGSGSVFRGTLVVDGPIHLYGNSSLIGRGLSMAGAISLENNVVNIPRSCVTPAAPIASVTIQPTCIVSTGTITVVSPIEIGMTYSIDNSTYTNTTGIFTLVPVGTYTVTLKNSNGGISAGTIVTIKAPEISVGCISPGTIVTINAPEISAGCVSEGTTVTINAPEISAGCISPGTIVTINTQPAKPVTPGAITGPATVYTGRTRFIYSVPVIVNATDYIWTLPVGATITSGANTNTITVGFSESSSGGNITVQGSNSCATGPVSAPFTIVVNNCGEGVLLNFDPWAARQGEYGIKVYPNPFTDHLYFELQLQANDKVRLEIFNINGVKVATVFSGDVKALNDYRLEYIPENISSGTYIYQLIVDERVLFTGKVIHK